MGVRPAACCSGTRFTSSNAGADGSPPSGRLCRSSNARSSLQICSLKSTRCLRPVILAIPPVHDPGQAVGQFTGQVSTRQPVGRTISCRPQAAPDQGLAQAESQKSAPARRPGGSWRKPLELVPDPGRPSRRRPLEQAAHPEPDRAERTCHQPGSTSIQAPGITPTDQRGRGPVPRRDAQLRCAPVASCPGSGELPESACNLFASKGLYAPAGRGGDTAGPAAAQGRRRRCSHSRRPGTSRSRVRWTAGRTLSRRRHTERRARRGLWAGVGRHRCRRCRAATLWPARIPRRVAGPRPRRPAGPARPGSRLLVSRLFRRCPRCGVPAHGQQHDPKRVPDAAPA